ncbi:MAG TPA: hypothetical protein VFD15_04200, partial [Clostridia bacterium]|nr:hypothetical protein [Clostridia bacterium]
SPDGYSITFRDLQKVSDQGGQTDTKPGAPRFVSHQKTDEMLRKQSPGEPLDKPMEKSLEKSLEQKGARETGTGAENNKAPFPFFKWKF